MDSKESNGRATSSTKVTIEQFCFRQSMAVNALDISCIAPATHIRAHETMAARRRAFFFPRRSDEREGVENLYH